MFYGLGKDGTTNIVYVREAEYAREGFQIQNVLT